MSTQRSRNADVIAEQLLDDPRLRDLVLRRLYRHTPSRVLADELHRVRYWVRENRAEEDRLRAFEPNRTCLVCGAPFRGRADAIYCRPACRQRAYRSRR